MSDAEPIAWRQRAATPAFIDGGFVPAASGATFQSIDPATDAVTT